MVLTGTRCCRGFPQLPERRVQPTSANPQPSAMRTKSVLPILNWLPSYQRAWQRPDLVAGITLAAYAIPVSLAYASLAGVPPQMGLYCYLVGGLGYVLFGSSRH